MTTIIDLDHRLNGLHATFKERLYNTTGSRAFNYKVLGTMENPELVEYTRDLHQLLLSEGFPSTYNVTDHQEFLLSQGFLNTYDVSNYPFSQDICLQLLPGPTGLIRVSVRHDGWLYTQWGDHIPNVFDAVSRLRAPIEALVTQLRMAQGIIEVRGLCATCYYSSASGRDTLYNDIYCGKGLLDMVYDVPVRECTSYRDRE